MKKRIFAVIMTAAMAMSMAVPAMAAPITSETTGDALLTYAVTSSYSVTIPDSVTLENGSGDGELSVDNGMLLDDGKALTVKVSSANYEATAGYRLKNGDSNYLNYALKTNTSSNDAGTASEVSENNAEVLRAVAGTDKAGKNTYFFYTADTPVKSGTYTDTLTFTVAVEDATPA